MSTFENSLVHPLDNQFAHTVNDFSSQESGATQSEQATLRHKELVSLAKPLSPFVKNAYDIFVFLTALFLFTFTTRSNSLVFNLAGFACFIILMGLHWMVTRQLNNKVEVLSQIVRDMQETQHDY